MRWLALVQFGVALILVVARARAEPGGGPPVVMTYEAPAGCPEEVAFRSDVASHVRAESHAPRVRVNITIEEQRTGYLGVLVAFDELGNESSRRIRGKTCVDVAHALAFLAGLVIELGGRIETDTLPAPTAYAPPVPPTPPPVVASPRAIDISAVVLAGTRGGFGPIVRISGEAGVEISARGGLLAPSVRASTFAGDSHLDGGVGSAALWFVGGRVEICPYRFGNEHVALRACAGGELGGVHAQGQVASNPRTVTELWASAEATLRVQWFATNSWFIELSGGPEFPIVRTRYYFEPDRTLYVVPALTARAAVGLGLQF
jgi:hypothetical protein